MRQRSIVHHRQTRPANRLHVAHLSRPRARLVPGPARAHRHQRCLHLGRRQIPRAPRLLRRLGRPRSLAEMDCSCKHRVFGLSLSVEVDRRPVRLPTALQKRLAGGVAHASRQHGRLRLARCIQRHVGPLGDRRPTVCLYRHIALGLHPRQRSIGPPMQFRPLGFHRLPLRDVPRIGQEGLLMEVVEIGRCRRHHHRTLARPSAHAHRRVHRQHARVPAVVRTRCVPRYRAGLELDILIGRRHAQLLQIHQPAGCHMEYLSAGRGSMAACTRSL